jgi:uncharacterized protein YecT (DUF1311 family)
MFAVLLPLALYLTVASPAPTAAPLDCRNAQTTIELDACAGRKRDAAQRGLRAALAKFPVPQRSSDAWRVMRATLCDDLIGEFYRGGSISSMAQTSCEARLTAEWAKRIAHPVPPASAAAIVAARRALAAFLTRYSAQITEPRTRDIYETAQAAWRVFAALEIERSGAGAEASLDRERIADLKASWFGERFW